MEKEMIDEILKYIEKEEAYTKNALEESARLNRVNSVIHYQAQLTTLNEIKCVVLFKSIRASMNRVAGLDESANLMEKRNKRLAFLYRAGIALWFISIILTSLHILGILSRVCR